MKILVAYASKYHSTAEIAEEIGKTLQQIEGFEVDVREVSTVKGLSQYRAVVLGSAVYMGQWQPAAIQFMTAYETELVQLPVWLFSSGPTGEGDGTETWKFPDALRPLATRIAPRDIAVFSGKLDPKNLQFGERTVVNALHTPTGDFRDWDAIRGWVNNHIVESLQLLRN